MVHETAEELRLLRVVDLKQKLSQLGLPQSGRKEDLVQRILEHYSRLNEHVEENSLDASSEDAYSLQPSTGENSREAFTAGDSREAFPQDNSPQGAGDAPEPFSEESSREAEYGSFSVEENSQTNTRPLSSDQSSSQGASDPEVGSSSQVPHSKPADTDNEGPEEVSRMSEQSPDQESMDTNVETPVESNDSLESVEQNATKDDQATESLDGQQGHVQDKEVASTADASQEQCKPTIKAALFNSSLNVPQFGADSSTVPSDGDVLAGLATPAGPLTKKLADTTGTPAAVVSETADQRRAESRSSSNDTDLKKNTAHPPGDEPIKVEKVSAEYEKENVDVKKDVVAVKAPGDKEPQGTKKQNKKKKKKNRPEEWARQAAEAERRQKLEEMKAELEEDKVEIEYVQEKIDLDLSNPIFRQFSKIFDNFRIVTENDLNVEQENKKNENLNLMGLSKVPKLLEADDLIGKDDEGDESQPKLSKRKLKKLSRLSVAELKQLVTRPDVVEMHDVTAKDPGLLVHLKSCRNTVTVPRHWCFKRKYLQGKRGIEKPPFNLPEFIKKTGIMEMRAALQEKEEAKNLKSKMREKVRPKLGKIDIDYQKLHDAFFKWQTKPRMTNHGDLYYEGKEFEIRLKEKKPGDLSDDLRTALGMPVGPNAHKVPPPWLIAMQRYGPPPSYPNLKIPGLNAPIPDGCSFGYHAGGWGKPPVDESGKPLYGDVFGTLDESYNQQMPMEEIDNSLWGEFESESEEEESEDEESEEEDEEDESGAAEKAGTQTPITDGGLITPSGVSSVAGLGQETPELIELRKRKIEADMEGGETPNLFTVLPERRTDRVGNAMMGSVHTYDIPPPPQASSSAPMRGVRPGSIVASGLDPSGVELALNPEEVDLMDTEAMTAKAEAALREKQASLAKEDLSDMVAEHAAKQSSKRKRQAGKEDSKSAKKYKEFKF